MTLLNHIRMASSMVAHIFTRGTLRTEFIFTLTATCGPREAGEPPECRSWSHLFHHWRSAAGHSKVRGATREDPRATGVTGVAAEPVGVPDVTMMEVRSREEPNKCWLGQAFLFF